MAGHKNLIPKTVEQWMVVNAACALSAAALSVACADLAPSLWTATLSLAWLYWRAAEPRAGAANAVTLCRMGLLCTVLAVAPDRGIWVVTVACAALVLDAADGWLARKLDQASAFGAHFDMECDSHALLLLVLHLAIHCQFGPWVLFAGALRYAFVLARFVAQPRELHERRSRSGRIVFAFVYASATLGCLPGARDVAAPLLAAATVAVSASFAPDFWSLRSSERWTRHAARGAVSHTSGAKPGQADSGR